MARKATNADVLKIFDNDLIIKAVNKVSAVLDDERAKTSEVLNAADKLIKFKFLFQDAMRKQVMDNIMIEMKQLDLEEKHIKLVALRGLQNPSSTPNEVKTFTRVYQPPKASEMEDYDGVKEA